MDQRKREKDRKKNRREAHRVKNTTMVVELQDNTTVALPQSEVWRGVVDAVDLLSQKEEKKEEVAKRNEKVNQLRAQLKQIREKMIGMDQTSQRFDALQRAELSTYKSLVRNLEVLKRG